MSIKQAAKFFNPAKPKPSGLSRHTKKQLVEWSLEANKIDPSRSVKEYYSMFLKRLRKKFIDSKDMTGLYENGVIEV